MKKNNNNAADKTILVVEDDPVLQEIIKFKLEKNGIKIVSAKDYDEAMLYLKKQKRPNLIWLDILLPGKNGLDFLQTLRQDKNLKDLSVVVVSVSGSKEKRERATALGAMEYIVKSENTLQEIIKKIEKYLK